MAVIDLCLITWPNHPARLEYLEKTVGSLKENLTASRHKIRWLCSAESERDPKYPWCGDGLERICRENGIELFWRPDGTPASCGANMNAAMRAGTGDVILLNQDDWFLMEPLNLSAGVDLLLSEPTVDLIRYSYPNNDRQRPTFRNWKYGWRQIDAKGQWPYGDDPNIRRRDFLEKWGWYKGARDHSQESDMLRRLVAGDALILAANKSYYAHFGAITALTNDTRWATETR